MMLCAKAYEIHNNETSVCRLFKGYEAKVVGMWPKVSIGMCCCCHSHELCKQDHLCAANLSFVPPM